MESGRAVSLNQIHSRSQANPSKLFLHSKYQAARDFTCIFLNSTAPESLVPCALPKRVSSDVTACDHQHSFHVWAPVGYQSGGPPLSLSYGHDPSQLSSTTTTITP